jgi:hypothetical protein
MEYKIIHQILAVNYNLKIWGKSENNLCAACNQTENIEHFIYDYPKTSSLWNTFQLWWKSVFHFSIMLSALEIIFGIPNENNDNSINVYNYVILYTKYYIYITQKIQKELYMYNLLLLIKKQLKLKRITYTEKQQLHKYNRLWGELYDIL